MKLEIDIPSILYQDAKENRNYISLTKLEIAWKAIANGKPIEQEPIKALGEELRKVREGIKDGIVLYGYDKAVAICNKYLEGSEE